MLHQIRAAALLYTKDTPNRNALEEFARELIARGWRVGGVVQEVKRHADGYKTQVDVVDIATGERFPINQPTREQIANNNCSLDVSTLSQSTSVLRKAIADHVDLLVVEKFGEQEQGGSGMAQEILTAMAEGIPTVVAVPAAVLNTWNQFCGGSAELLPRTPEALWRWWGAHNLRRELINGVRESGGDAQRVVVGMNWTLVEGPHGCGLAHTPARQASGCQAVPTGQLTGRPLAELAKLAESWNPFETAIGLAAINARYDRYDLQSNNGNGPRNGLAAFAGVEGPVSVVGRFPAIREYLPQARIIEQNPKPGEYPAAAASRLLPDSEAVLITASTLVNHTLENLLDHSRDARVALVGPGTPLAPTLHSYGIELLAGQVVEDPEGAARTVAEGGSVKALKPHCRQINLRAPSVS